MEAAQCGDHERRPLTATNQFNEQDDAISDKKERRQKNMREVPTYEGLRADRHEQQCRDLCDSHVVR